MFCYVTNIFLFHGKIVDQVDGVGMGSPLEPALANLFIGYNEQKWSESDHVRVVTFYRTYMEDIFYVFENEYRTLTFFDFLHIQHPNSNFTIEKEYMRKLPFWTFSKLVQTD